MVGKLLLLVCLTYAIASAAQTQTLGYVLEVQGTWVDNENHPVAKWSALLESTTLRRQGRGSDKDLLRLRVLGKEVVIRCTTASTCAGPIPVRPQVRANNIDTGIIGRLLRSLKPKQETTMGRGAGANEYILSMTGTGIDLAPVFSGDPPNANSVGVLVCPLDGACPTVNANDDLTCILNEQSLCRTTTMKPGAYEIRQYSVRAARLGKPTEDRTIFGLIVPVAQRATALKQWNELLAVIKQWEPTASVEQRELRRAALRELAAQYQK